MMKTQSPTTRPRAAVYVRVSTEEQSASVEAQESGARVWCEAHGYDVVQVYRDVGISGAEWPRRLSRTTSSLTWWPNAPRSSGCCAGSDRTQIDSPPADCL